MANATTFALTGHTGDSVHVYSPASARRYSGALDGNTASVSIAPPMASTPY